MIVRPAEQWEGSDGLAQALEDQAAELRSWLRAHPPTMATRERREWLVLEIIRLEKGAKALNGR